jgi:hypothetical protein
MFQGTGRTAVLLGAAGINYAVGAQQKEIDWLDEMRGLGLNALTDFTGAHPQYGALEQYVAHLTYNIGADLIGVPKQDIHSPSSLLGDAIANGANLGSDLAKMTEKVFKQEPITLVELLNAMHHADRSVVPLVTGLPLEVLVQPSKAAAQALEAKPNPAMENLSP